MEERKSATFYSGSFYEKINDFEKFSDKNNEIKNDAINNEKNYIIINNCPKDKMNSLIYSIGNEINNWKSDMMRQFYMMTEEFNIIKSLIQNSQKQKIESLTEKNTNEINLLKNNSSLSEEKKNNLSKLNKTSSDLINNNSFNKNNHINNAILENKDEIKEICQKMKEINLIQISSKYDNTIKQNIIGIESLLNNDESDDKSKETKLDTSNDIGKNIIVPKAFSYFGLDNQFEIIKYKENYLLIHIDNFNDLILKLINKQNQIIQIYIIKKVFENEIREIKYFNFEEKDMNYDFLLVSSRKNELKVYKLLLDCEFFQDILEEINHIKDIYKKEGKLNEDFFDLSSCVIRFNKENDIFEILTTCWEGHSIKIYNLFNNDYIKEIVSKTSCNIKYCNLVDNDYFVFCGCNSQDNYTCANCIDLKNLDYSIQRDESVEFIKYSDNSAENRENVFFNFMVYDSPYDSVKYLILCDEKGYIRFFNFDFKNKILIKKIFPSSLNKNINYKNPKMYRLNSIILCKENYLLITERNTGYVYKISVPFDNDKKCCVKTIFRLFDKEIISLRKYENDDYILALGKNYKSQFEEEEKILCFKFG